MSGVLELLPHDMGLRVELDTNETYYLKADGRNAVTGFMGLLADTWIMSKALRVLKNRLASRS